MARNHLVADVNIIREVPSPYLDVDSSHGYLYSIRMFQAFFSFDDGTGNSGYIMTGIYAAEDGDEYPVVIGGWIVGISAKYIPNLSVKKVEIPPNVASDILDGIGDVFSYTPV